VLQFEVKTAKQSRKSARLLVGAIRRNFRSCDFIQIVCIVVVATAQGFLRVDARFHGLAQCREPKWASCRAAALRIANARLKFTRR
jgi:hypothetical protein